MAKIYYLHTGDFIPKYVGSTTQSLQTRKENHSSDFRNNSPKTDWIQQLKNNGGALHICLIESCDKVQRYSRENYWIEHFKSEGVELLNITNAITSSDKQKQIAKEVMVKRMQNPLMKEKVRQALRMRRKAIEVNGVVYNGIIEAARVLGISSGYLCSMAKGKSSKKFNVKYA